MRKIKNDLIQIRKILEKLKNFSWFIEIEIEDKKYYIFYKTTNIQIKSSTLYWIVSGINSLYLYDYCLLEYGKTEVIPLPLSCRILLNIRI